MDLKNLAGAFLLLAAAAAPARFYATLRRWFDADDLPKLTEAEVARFVKADGEAYSLYQECRL